MIKPRRRNGIGALPRPKRTISGGGIQHGGRGVGHRIGMYCDDDDRDPDRHRGHDHGHHDHHHGHRRHVSHRVLYHCPCPDEYNGGAYPPERVPGRMPKNGLPGRMPKDNGNGHHGVPTVPPILTAPPQVSTQPGVGWSTGGRPLGWEARAGTRGMTFKNRKYKKLMGKGRRPLTLTAKTHARDTGYY